jgi:hypothetical protein
MSDLLFRTQARRRWLIYAMSMVPMTAFLDLLGYGRDQSSMFTNVLALAFGLGTVISVYRILSKLLPEESPGSSGSRERKREASDLNPSEAKHETPVT